MLEKAYYAITILILACVLAYFYNAYTKCEEVGGTLMRPVFGFHKCVNITEIE